jgi:hypothetical protein
MGIRGELFSTKVTVENRTYFFNVKENRMGDIFLNVVESKKTDAQGFDRHAIVLFKDDMQPFLQGLDKALRFMEKTLQKHEVEGRQRPGDRRSERPAGEKRKLHVSRKEAPPAARETKTTGKLRVVPRKAPPKE